MAHRNFRRGAQAIRKARETLWLFIGSTDTTLTAAGGSIIVALNAAALALRPFTIVRTHFEVAVRSDQAAAIETQAVGVGFAVVNDQALSVGVTAVPTPVSESGSSLWFLHRFIFADESNLTDRTRSARFVEIDSKVMRKVDLGQDLLGVVELDTTAGSGGAIVSVAGRMLIKTT